jgi:hypothetical protein
MNYKCPVCGYNKMTRPPQDFYICPSCGTEFENDDTVFTHQELRDLWVEHGARWFSRATPKPPGWNPYIQLLSAGYIKQTASDETLPSRVIQIASSRIRDPWVIVRTQLVDLSGYTAELLGRVSTVAEV